MENYGTITSFLGILLLTLRKINAAGKMKVVLIHPLLACFIYAANITLAPSSVTAPLYKMANFTCEGRGDSLVWTVQDHSLTDVIEQYREISVTTNNISII